MKNMIYSLAVVLATTACSRPDVSIQDNYRLHHIENGIATGRHIQIRDNMQNISYAINDFGNDKYFDELFIMKNNERTSYLNLKSIDLPVMENKLGDHKNSSIISNDSMNVLIENIFNKYNIERNKK